MYGFITMSRIRPFFQFTVRQILLLTTVVAICAAYLVHRVGHAADVARSVEKLRQAHASVMYDNQYDTTDHTSFPEPGGPRWLRRLFGQFIGTNVRKVHLGATIDRKVTKE